MSIKYLGFGASTRSGYALLFTLFIIFAITIILSQILQLSDKSIRSSNQIRDYIQLSSLTKDVIKIIKKAPELKDIKDADTFDAFLQSFSLIPIKFKDGTKAVIEIKPSSTAININNIPHWNRYQKERFVSFLRSYGVISADYFLNLLIDITTPKSTLTDIKNDLPSLNSKTLNKYRDFEKIERYYISITKDYNILYVPWKKIISFHGNELDANYISCELWKLIYFDSPNDEMIQSICNKKEILSDINDLNIPVDILQNIKKFHITTDTQKINIEIKLYLKDKKDIISTFSYDIRTKKVSNVSMAF